MTTRAELRTRIRTELNDSGGTPLWPAANLDQWIADALQEFGRRFPRERTSTIPSVANQQAYNLPADFRQAVRVEHPDGLFRSLGPLHSGEAEPGALIPQPLQPEPGGLWYETWAGQLVLTPAPDAAGESIVLRYMAGYTLPTADASVLDVAADDEPVLVHLICAAAFAWLGADEAKRQRFERDRGSDPRDAGGRHRREAERLIGLRARGVRSRRLVPRE